MGFSCNITHICGYSLYIRCKLNQMIRSYAWYWYCTLTLHGNVDIENTSTRIDKIFCKARNIISW